MNNLVDYFKKSGTKLGVFYPTHQLIAVFRDPVGAEAAVHKLWNAGFAPSDAIAADGKAVLEFAEAETDLASLLMRPISRFFTTEQAFADHDLEDARQGAGFLAVHCATDELKDAAWTIVEPEEPLDARYYAALGIEHLAGDWKTD
jgi:hypothetical protein